MAPALTGGLGGNERHSASPQGTWQRNNVKTVLFQTIQFSISSHMAEQKQDGQLEHTYSSFVRIQDVALKTCQRR